MPAHASLPRQKRKLEINAPCKATVHGAVIRDDYSLISYYLAAGAMHTRGAATLEGMTSNGGKGDGAAVIVGIS